jgi:hypothetical protein
MKYAIMEKKGELHKKPMWCIMHVLPLFHVCVTLIFIPEAVSCCINIIWGGGGDSACVWYVTCRQYDNYTVSYYSSKRLIIIYKVMNTGLQEKIYPNNHRNIKIV